MRPVCLIPARSGSKGLPDKNMLFLDGEPMIFHTIRAAIESGIFRKEDIYVSTDSELYAEICRKTGVSVQMRPKELALDTTTSVELNEYFLKDFKDGQIFVLLQITSPLRTGEDIKKAFELFTYDVENVVSYSKVEKTPKFFTDVDDEGFIKSGYGVDTGYRRQDQKILYAPNGAIYIARKKSYLESRSYFTSKTKAYIMSKETSIDVDDRADFLNVIAMKFFDYKKRENKNKLFYKEALNNLAKNRKFTKVFIGDNRSVGLDFAGYDNFSVNGITMNTVVENFDTVVSKDVSKVVVSLGVNDLIAGYSKDEIRSGFETFVRKCKQMNIEVVLSGVVLTLFRENVKNDSILELNEWLADFAKKEEVLFVDPNVDLAKNGNLEFDYTSDGLHFNDEGKKRYLEFLLKI